jgi:hypothetical protein
VEWTIASRLAVMDQRWELTYDFVPGWKTGTVCTLRVVLWISKFPFPSIRLLG